MSTALEQRQERRQVLWDAHKALIEVRNKLRAVGCDASVRKVEGALVSVGASFGQLNRRHRDEAGADA